MPVTVLVMAAGCCILFLGSEKLWTGCSEPLFPTCAVAKHHLISLAFLLFIFSFLLPSFLLSH